MLIRIFGVPLYGLSAKGVENSGILDIYEMLDFNAPLSLLTYFM